MFKMARGIVSTIVIYSLVQIGCLALAISTDKINDNYLIFEPYSYSNFRVAFMLFSLIGIIMLGFNLNKKYSEVLTFWKFIVAGLCVLFISYPIFYIGYISFDNLFLSNITFSKEGLFNNLIRNIGRPGEYLGYSIIILFVVAIFHKKLKFRETQGLIDKNCKK